MLKGTYPVITTVLIVGIVGGIAQITRTRELPISTKVMENATTGKPEVSPTPMSDENEVSKFTMTIKEEEDAEFTRHNIPIVVTMHNGDELPVKLIDSFNDSFFRVTLSDENGSPLFTVGGRKVQFGTSIPYIYIKSKEDFSKKLNVADYVPKSITITPGTYKVSVVYQNRYGDDSSFKGQLKSNSLALVLK